MGKRDKTTPTGAADNNQGKGKWFMRRTLLVTGFMLIYLLPIYHTYELRQISGSLSTRYLDEFPKNIDDVTSFISKAQRELLIQTDIFSYGVFSRPDLWNVYRKELEVLLSNKVAISVRCYDTTMLRIQLNRQFGFDTLESFVAKRLVDGKASARYASVLDSVKQVAMDTLKSSTIGKGARTPRRTWELFSEHCKTVIGNDVVHLEWIRTTDDFVTRLIAINEHFIRELGNKTEPRIHFERAHRELSSFAWLRDQQEAVFSIIGYRAGATEFSFETNDDDFIDAVLGPGGRRTRIAD